MKNCNIHYTLVVIRLITSKTTKINPLPLRKNLISNIYIPYFIYWDSKPVRGTMPDIYPNHSNLNNCTNSTPMRSRNSCYWFPLWTQNLVCTFSTPGNMFHLSLYRISRPPIALAMQFTANGTAGHLLIHLIRGGIWALLSISPLVLSIEFINFHSFRVSRGLNSHVFTFLGNISRPTKYTLTIQET